MSRYLAPFLAALLVLVSATGMWASAAIVLKLDRTPAERIVIEKSLRRLTLFKRNGEQRIFNVALGQNPVGHKTQQGDSRTPEGAYHIDFKNIESDFYLSVRISYPNDTDRSRASEMGVHPGGNIMIHGYPNDARWPYERYIGRDWTEGCIAVSNAAMQEIWLATRENTPVEILP